MITQWLSKIPHRFVDKGPRIRKFMMDLGWKSSVLALWIFVLYTTSVCLVRGFGISNQIRPFNNRNCTTPPCRNVFHLTFAEKVRIDMLKKHIMNELNIQDKIQVQNTKLTEKETKNLPQKDKTPQTPQSQPMQEPELPEMAEIVSFSEKPENISGRNVLSFSIDVSTKPKEYIEAVSAHLWILMRKRKRGRSRGRKVILRVMKVPNQKDEKFHYLTALRTRVKKTRWQKISLPVTLIQSMLDSKDNALNLRISCKHCGRMVRPVLFRRENKNLKNGKIRKRKGKGKGKRRRRRRRMRNKRTNENNRIQPFLVISTRYRHTFKQS